MRKSFVKRKPQSTDMALQITSMADIFMILLVFLLKNYSTSLTTIAPSAQLSLPEVTKANSTVKETVKVEIAPDAIIIDQKPVASLRNFVFGSSDAGQNGTSLAVTQALQRQRSMLPEPNTDSSLVLMADQHAPYETIKRVVASAAGAGFVDLQFVVVETE